MLPRGDGICYSGYREGQSPDARIYPSMEQIREDLRLLRPHWRLLRLYDCSPHAERVLEVIRRDRLDFSVLLGGWLAAETSNPGCPWGGVYDDDRLAANAVDNDEEMERLVSLAGRYDDIVCAVAVGNEATVDWTDHLVPVERVIGHVRRVRRAVAQPVTVCENHVPWQHKLRDLVPELDFISLHSYPVWEYRGVEGALEHTRADCERTRHANPGKPIVITEAGWTTGSNGRGIEPWNASESAQERYCTELRAWSNAEGVTTFVFEAFDEPWKGSPDPLEPEKHWGFYTVDRRPKQVMRAWAGAGTAHGVRVAPGCGGATRNDRGLD